MENKMANGYWKDPELAGYYVMRCKCGARPYHDRIYMHRIEWIKCACCGKTGESGFDKEEAIKNWNEGKYVYDKY